MLFTRELFREGTYPANLLGGIDSVQIIILCPVIIVFREGTYPANLLGGIDSVQIIILCPVIIVFREGTYTPQVKLYVLVAPTLYTAPRSFRKWAAALLFCFSLQQT